jgi:dephospho-CoA kinase
MKRIALTGGVGCGKSTLARFLVEQGCEVLDADDVVHQLESSGGAAVTPILKTFGPSVLAIGGGIDRPKLGRIVFADPDARTRLNAIVHPLAKQVMEEWLRKPDARLRVAVVPLLFEAGWAQGWDAIICMACQEAEQVRRLIARGLTEADARARIAAQMPLAEKIQKADRTIWNDADEGALRHEAVRLLKWISEK